MDLWNNVVLCAPSGDFCEYSFEDPKTFDSILVLADMLADVANEIGPRHILWSEVKVLEALKRRMTLKLSADKFLHLFQRICMCLKTLVTMNLAQEFVELSGIFLNRLSYFPEYIEVSEGTLRLPSRQQLEYLLIRTLSSSKLICKILLYCEATFTHILKRFTVGHMTHCLLMVLSAVARVRCAAKALLMQLCNNYRHLKPMCAVLKEGTWTWDMNLPDDLWQWLEETDKIPRKTFPNSQLDFLSNIFSKSSEEPLAEDAPRTRNFVQASYDASSDVGERVERCNFGEGQELAMSYEIEDGDFKESNNFLVTEAMHGSNQIFDDGSSVYSKDESQQFAESLTKRIEKVKKISDICCLFSSCIDQGNLTDHQRRLISNNKRMYLIKALKELKCSLKIAKRFWTGNVLKLRFCKKQLLKKAKRDFIASLNMNR